MGWRMGIGETYMAYWHGTYQDLDAENKQNYHQKYRAPLYWYWAYWNLESPFVAIVVAISALLTWVPRILLHWMYRLWAAPRIGIPD